jgi:hypothetical protein
MVKRGSKTGNTTAGRLRKHGLPAVAHTLATNPGLARRVLNIGCTKQRLRACCELQPIIMAELGLESPDRRLLYRLVNEYSVAIAAMKAGTMGDLIPGHLALFVLETAIREFDAAAARAAAADIARLDD